MAAHPQTMTPNNMHLHALGLTPLQPHKPNRSKPRPQQALRNTAEHMSQLKQTYHDATKSGKLPPLKNAKQVQ